MKIENKNIVSGEEIATEFGKSAHEYHQKAEIQKKVAEGLIASLRPWKEILPTGPILEVGCGTGFLTEYIFSEFPTREFVITDASIDMVSFTKGKLGDSDLRSYSVLDVNTIEETAPKYSMIVSNFAAQWFEDTTIGLEKLSQLLVPGGLMLIAFPGNQSFTQWYECCLELGLPFTANTLPDVEEVIVKLSLGPLQIDYYENDLNQDFNSSLDFLKHIKEIGAGKSLSGKTMTPKQLRLLTSYWDKKVEGNIKVKWHIVYLAAKKDMH